jgi:hypothetical protein
VIGECKPPHHITAVAQGEGVMIGRGRQKKLEEKPTCVTIDHESRMKLARTEPLALCEKLASEHLKCHGHDSVLFCGTVTVPAIVP